MNLFKFELKKLFLNKKTIIMLVALFVFYFFVGVAMSNYMLGSKESNQTYSALVNEFSGSINEEQAALSREAQTRAKEMYGDNVDALDFAKSTDPVLRFNLDYAAFADSVDEYYNGADTDNVAFPYGVNVIKERMATLEANGEQNTFAYSKLENQLAVELELGEPQFGNTSLWNNLLNMWGGWRLMILLFVPLAFIAAPVFAMEATTGMDNVLLSSKNGRKKIVTAKLISVAIACSTVIILYLIATFFGNFMPYGSFAGGGEHLRSAALYVRTPIDLLVGQFTFLSASWILLVGVVFSMLVALISSKVNSMMATFGISIVLLAANMFVGAMGQKVIMMIKPIIDFGFVNLINVNTMFSTYKVHNVFGLVVPYYVMALIVMGVFSALGILLMYRFQKRRMVA